MSDLSRYTDWDSVLYKSKSSGGYAIKASAARRGVTMDWANKNLGPLPKQYEGKVSGYNPNLAKTNNALAKSLGMDTTEALKTLDKLNTPAAPKTNTSSTPYGTVRTVDVGGQKQEQYWTGNSWKKKTGPIPNQPGTGIAPAASPKTNALAGMTATPVQYANNALVNGTPLGTVRAGVNGSGNVEWTANGWQATTKPVTPTASTLNAGPGGYRVSDDPVAAPTTPDYSFGATNAMVAPSAPVDHETRKAQAYNDGLRRERDELIGYIQGQPAGSPAIEGYEQRLREINTVLSAVDNPGSTILNPPKPITVQDKIAALKAEGRMPWDDGHPELQQMYAQALLSGTDPSTARQQVDRYSMGPIFGGINDFLTGNPVGQAVAPALAAGVGWSSASPTSTPDYTSKINTAADTYKGTQPSPLPSGPDASAFPGVNVPTPGALANMPNENKLGMTTIDPTGTTVPQPSVGTTPVMDKPASSLPTTTTAGVIGGATAVGAGGIPSTTTGGVNGTMTGGTATPPPSPTGTTTTTPPPPPTGTNSTGTGTTATKSWWQDPSTLAWLTAAGFAVDATGKIVSAKMQGDAATEAAQIQANAAKEAGALQEKMFNQIREDQEPWRTAGSEALQGLRTFETDNPDFVFNTTGPNMDPSYSWRLSEGLKALENSVASRGMLNSGNTLKAITEYGQGAASQEYNNAFNRYTTQRGQKLNRLQSLAGVGQTAVQQVGAAGQNYANNAGNALMTGANATAAGKTGAADAWGSAAAGVGGSALAGLSNWYQGEQRNYLMNALLAGR